MKVAFLVLGSMVSISALAAKTNTIEIASTGDVTGARDVITNAISSVQSTVNDLSSFSVAVAPLPQTCIVDVTLNGSTGYELPTNATELSELASGAKLTLSIPGWANPISASVPSLVGCKVRFIAPISAGTSINGYLTLSLGSSGTCAYGAVKTPVVVASGVVRNVALQTIALTGTTVEVARIQPWNSTATGDGASFIGTRITTKSGTRFIYGGYGPDGAWVDQSLTKVTIYDCPKDSDGNPLTPVARSISTGGGGNAVELSDRLNCLKNMKIVYATFSGTTSLTNNEFVRYDPLWVKTEKATIPVPTFDASGNAVSTQNLVCLIKWFCNTQADADYHLHPLFVRYQRNASGGYDETALAHGYIARYPIKVYDLTTSSQTISVGGSLPDSSREVGASRMQFLGYCTAINQTDITISAAGETNLTIAAGSDARCASMCNLADISFLQSLGYLMFGVNVQSYLPGVSVGSASSTTNGATAYMSAEGVWTGAQDTTSASNPIIFLGIEDGLWSSTGWMHPDQTAVWRRTTTTDATGAISSDATDRFYLFAQDRADYAPSSSSDAAMLAAGYRRVSFQPITSSGYGFRVGYDPSVFMRDLFLPSADQAQPNISIGGADYEWSGAFPAVISSYSASLTYAVGSYVTYNSIVYRCATAVTAAEAFDSSKWEAQVSATIQRDNWYMVALGTSRGSGGDLGLFFVFATGSLSYGDGHYWRSRVSLQPFFPAER